MNTQKKWDGPDYLREAGQFIVEVIKAEKTKSKKGNPMLVVTFKDLKAREINGYYVNNSWGLEALEKLKFAADLPPTAKAEDLLGKKLQIVVAFQDPNKTGGKVYTEIREYHPVNAVDPADDFNTAAMDAVEEEEKLPW